MMERFFFRLALLVLFFFVLIASLVGLIAVASPKDVTPFANIFQPDPTCALPCWHGIRPGQTTVDQAYQIMADNPTSVSGLTRLDTDMFNWQMPALPSGTAYAVAYHVFGRPGDQIQAIRFDLPDFPTFRLADAISLWGTPSNAVVYYCSGADADHAFADVRFNGNIEVRTVEFFNNWYGHPTPAVVNLRPDIQLIMVRYYADSFDMTWRWSGVPKWRGFNTWPVTKFGHTSMCGM